MTMRGGAIPSITYINNISSLANFAYVDSNNEVQEIKGEGTFELESKFISIDVGGDYDLEFSTKNNGKAMFIYKSSSLNGSYINGSDTISVYPNGLNYCIPFTDLKIEIVTHEGPTRP